MLRQRYLYEKQKWEAEQKGRVLPLPALPPTVLQNEAKKPETKVADKPQAKAQPIPGPNTQAGQELTVRPKAAPQTVKPEAKVDELPQPVTPDAPRNNQPPQSPPPRGVDPRVVPPIIITAGALGKLTLDKLSNEQKAKLQAAGHTLPSMLPDLNRLPEGSVKISTKRDKDVDNSRAINRENESAKTLAEHGYKVNQLSDTTAGKLQGIKKPDFEIEGNVFDNYAPSANKSARGVWSEIRDKVSNPKTGAKQADRFVINMSDSKLSFDEMTKQFKDFPLDGLKEIILVRNGEATLFFPFKQ